MAQTTSRPPPRPTTTTVHPEPEAPSIPRPAPVVAAPVIAMPPMVTDRNLLDQLRQIYQTSQRHLPVPSGTKVSKALEDALDEIAEIAERAVKGYSP